MAKSQTQKRPVGLVEAAPPEGWNVRQVWVDPESLTPNPDNWRTHDEAQGEVIGSLLDEHGWLQPLLYNEKTGHLVNGHQRRELAIERGEESVPVWVGSWSEAQEAEILALLDESGTMAGGDAKKLKALLDRVKAPNPHVAGLIERMKEDHRVDELLRRTAAPQLVTGAAAGGQPAEEDEPPLAVAPVPAAPLSHVRMVQLFLNTTTYPLFQGYVERLGQVYGTENATDTVMECLRRAAAEEGEEGG